MIAIYLRLFFLQYCTHQFWMGSISSLKL